MQGTHSVHGLRLAVDGAEVLNEDSSCMYTAAWGRQMNLPGLKAPQHSVRFYWPLDVVSPAAPSAATSPAAAAAAAATAVSSLPSACLPTPQVRRKDFWLLNTVPKLLHSFIPKLCHEADGLILQASGRPFRCMLNVCALRSKLRGDY